MGQYLQGCINNCGKAKTALLIAPDVDAANQQRQVHIILRKRTGASAPVLQHKQPSGSGTAELIHIADLQDISSSLQQEVMQRIVCSLVSNIERHINSKSGQNNISTFGEVAPPSPKFAVMITLNGKQEETAAENRPAGKVGNCTLRGHLS